MSTRAPRRIGRLRTALAAVATAVAGLLALPALPAAAYTPLPGNDVSWPQCPIGMGSLRPTKGLPMPPSTSKFVIIGLTNGPGFSPNPCLASQLAWAKSHHVYTAAYAVATYPTNSQYRVFGAKGPWSAATDQGRLRNVGYAQALYNVANLKKTGFVTPMVWIDVESYPFRPWVSNVLRNRAVVQGLVYGYQRSGYRVGFYSTRYMWKSIVGNLSYRYPEWYPVGSGGRTAALAACHSTPFQGGRIIVAQWATRTMDYDVSCPNYSSTGSMGYYFHKY